MPTKYPIDIDVFMVPHARMKELVQTYEQQITKTDFENYFAVEYLLHMLETTFCEFKSHEQIENYYIMDKLQERLLSRNLSNKSICGCHKDNRLIEMLELVHHGYSYASRSADVRYQFCKRLLKELKDFTAKFIPHMEEEEEIFQPLLMECFDYEELKSLKESVIHEHESWKENLFSGGSALSRLETLFMAISELATKNEEILHAEDCAAAVAVPEPPSLVEALPSEILMNIFRHLAPPDRGSCAKVCRRWNEVVYSPRMWPELYLTSWAHDSARRVNLFLVGPAVHILNAATRAEGIPIPEQSRNDSLYSRGSWVYAGVDCEDYLSEIAAPSNRQNVSYEDFEELGGTMVPSNKLIEYRWLETSFIDSILPELIPRIGSEVKKLVLSCCKGLTNAQLNSILIICVDVQYVDVSYTDITDGAFRNLRLKDGCSQLTHLILDGCERITDIAVERLGACFLTRSTCHQMSVDSCCSKRRRVEPNSRSSPGLAHLSISGCSKITDYGLRSLLKVTLIQKSLEYLDISGCFNISANLMNEITTRAPRLLPEKLSYCSLVKDGPYQTEANGCQNLGCGFRSCCCFE